MKISKCMRNVPPTDSARYRSPAAGSRLAVPQQAPVRPVAGGYPDPAQRLYFLLSDQHLPDRQRGDFADFMALEAVNSAYAFFRQRFLNRWSFLQWVEMPGQHRPVRPLLFKRRKPGQNDKQIAVCQHKLLTAQIRGFV